MRENDPNRVGIGLRLLLIGLGLGAASCADRGSDAGPEVAALEQELKLMREEMAMMRQAITDIHRQTVINAGAPRQAAQRPAVPRPAVSEVLLSSAGQAVGNDQATVGIVEFSDYQCPYCARYNRQTFPELLESFIDTGKVRYFFRNYPLGIHAEARPAAIAAECAGQQDAFLPAAKALFANYRSLDQATYRAFVDQFELDAEAFDQCLNDPNVAARIDSDLLYAQSIGVSGTPTFFVGRIDGDKLVDVRRLVGAQSLKSFSALIEIQLAAR